MMDIDHRRGHEMKVNTLKFGKMNVPDEPNELMGELERCKERYMKHPTHYLQARIDAIEERIDRMRRE